MSYMPERCHAQHKEWDTRRMLLLLFGFRILGFAVVGAE